MVGSWSLLSTLVKLQCFLNAVFACCVKAKKRLFQMPSTLTVFDCVLLLWLLFQEILGFDAYFLHKCICISSASSSFQCMWQMLPWPCVGFPTRDPQVSQISKLAQKLLAAHVKTENESSQCRSWEITNHNLSVSVLGGACSENSGFFSLTFM